MPNSTKTKKMRLALPGSEELFRQLIESAADVFFVLDRQGRILDVNQDACESLGYGADELLSKAIWDISPTWTPERFAALASEMEVSGPVTSEALYVRRDGSAFPVEVRACLCESEGQQLVIALASDITQRKQMEEALRKSEERFRRIFDYSNDAILVIDPKRDQILDANPCASRMLGYSREELVALPISAIHPEELPQLLRFAASVFSEGSGWTDELTCLTKSGQHLAAEISASVIDIGEQNCMIALVRDISERKRAEQALRESEERLSRILESAMDAILAIDEQRRITLFNRAAEKVFRCSAAEVIGQPFERFFCEPCRSWLVDHVEGTLPDEQGKQTIWAPEGLTALRADGEEFPIEATISRVQLSGQKLYTIILRDINDRKKAEEELAKLHLAKVYLEEELKAEYNFGEIVGTSEPMKRLFQSIEKVAATDSTVLITGETGTGKEVVARAIHSHSHRKDRVLVKVNCAALPSGLIESELFGHEKGAFTGATMRKKGRFELADGGTIFLDEVGELPLDTQAKLLRVLQDREFERVGGTQTLEVDVRIIAASNRNLKEAVEAGAFRDDLFYRLNIFPLHIPPLRERREDIPLLADHFIRKFSHRLGKRIDGLAPQTLHMLLRYHWPGNVRELANVLERAVILCDRGSIALNHISIPISAPPADAGISTLEEAERLHIQKALEKTGGVVGGPTGAAKLLGMNRTTLLSRMKKLGIEPKQHP